MSVIYSRRPGTKPRKLQGWCAKKAAMISLSRFTDQYVASRIVSPTYAKRLKSTALALEAFAGLEAIDELLVEPVVNGFLRSHAQKSPFTVRSERSDILSLWNGAADADLLAYPVMRRIRLAQAPELLVECYTVDEVRELAAAAVGLVGVYRWGVTRRAYWSAAIRLAWDTGLRRGDVIRFRRDAVRPDGVARVLQAKTKKVVPAKLRPTTIAALDAVGGLYPLRWATDIGYFSRHFRRLVVASGVSRGSFKWLRRASGSYVEADQPGAGHKHLGQSGAQVFTRHYDAKLGGHNLPQPPEL